MNYLDYLKNKTVLNVSIEIDETIPLYYKKGNRGESSLELPAVIEFSDNYSLSIYNSITLQNIKDIQEIIGIKVLNTFENESETVFTFENNKKIIVDMRSENFKGPEAMCLNGPDSLIVVWD